MKLNIFKLLSVFVLVAVPLVAQTPAQKKELSHVERFSSPQMLAEKQEKELTGKLEKKPNDAKLLNERALARMRLGKNSEAAADLQKAIALSPNTSEYFANLGYALWKTGKFREAIAAEQKALSLNKNNFTANYQLGRFLMRFNGNAKDALIHLKKALELDPRQFEVRFELIAAYRTLGDLANATAQLTLLQDARPSDPRVDYVRALLKVDRGELKSAVKDFQDALRKDDSLLGAWQDLGLTFIKLGEFGEAVGAFAELVKRQPNSAEAAYFHALALYNSGQIERAESEIRRTLRLNQGAPEAHILLGVILATSRKNSADAIDSLTQAVSLDPNNFDANFYLGRTFYGLKQFGKAVEYFRKAVEINPKHIEARFFLGTTLEAFGNTGDALKEYEELVKLDPNSVYGQLGLGALYVKQGKTTEAIEVLRKAASLNPKNFETQWALGRALMLTKEYEEAVGIFRKAVELEPKRSDAHYQLGLALRRTGKNEDAAKEFEIVDRLNEEFRNSTSDNP